MSIHYVFCACISLITLHPKLQEKGFLPSHKEQGLVTAVECFSLGCVVNAELANAMSCKLAHEIGLHVHMFT